MTEYIKTGLEKTCYGCRACEQVCPRRAILMQPNAEGFLYPILNENKCIKCNKCADICPYEGMRERERTPISSFAAQYNEADALLESSSGGVFSALSDYVLEQGGYVSGCVFNESFLAVHTVTCDRQTVAKMRGSKYVQSDIGDCYRQIKTLLAQDKKVLFTGTPCQVDGLKRFLNKDYDGLFTVDLICHGVPSPLVLSKYLDTVRAKQGEITELTFRNKKRNGWCAQGSIGYGGKVKTISPFNSSYYNLFLQNSISRMSCYDCKYACTDRVGDITVGDFWGAENILTEICAEKGVSALLVNTYKGQALLSEVRDRMVLCEVKLDVIVKNNGNLRVPSEMPKGRAEIFNRIEKDGYGAVAKTDCRYQYVRPLLRKLIPKKLKKTLKKLLKRS